jgi:hypothetical protein
VKSGVRSVNIGKGNGNTEKNLWNGYAASSSPFVIEMNRFQVTERSSFLYERLVMKRCKGCMLRSLCAHSVDHPVTLKVNVFCSFVPYFHHVISDVS